MSLVWIAPHRLTLPDWPYAGRFAFRVSASAAIALANIVPNCKTANLLGCRLARPFDFRPFVRFHCIRRTKGDQSRRETCNARAAHAPLTPATADGPERKACLGAVRWSGG